MSAATEPSADFRADRLFTESDNFTDMERWHRAAADLRRAGPVHHFSDREVR